MQANKLKESGKAKFQKDFSGALADYTSAAELASGAELETLAVLWLSCKLNMALCCSNLLDHPSAIAHASEVIKKDASNVKVLLLLLPHAYARSI